MHLDARRAIFFGLQTDDDIVRKPPEGSAFDEVNVEGCVIPFINQNVCVRIIDVAIKIGLDR